MAAFYERLYQAYFDPEHKLHGEVQLIVGIAVLAIILTVCWYVIGKVRRAYRESDPGAVKLLTNFRDLHAQGELSDEEYRNIKSKLATRIRDQVDAAEQVEFEDTGK